MQLCSSVRLYRALFLSAVMTLVGFGNVSAAKGNSPISFRVPSGWKLIKEIGSISTVHVVVYQIHVDSVAEVSPIVMLKSYKLLRGRDIHNVDLDALAAQATAGGAQFCETNDGRRIQLRSATVEGSKKYFAWCFKS